MMIEFTPEAIGEMIVEFMIGKYDDYEYSSQLVNLVEDNTYYIGVFSSLDVVFCNEFNNLKEKLQKSKIMDEEFLMLKEEMLSYCESCCNGTNRLLVKNMNHIDIKSIIEKIVFDRFHALIKHRKMKINFVYKNDESSKNHYHTASDSKMLALLLQNKSTKTKIIIDSIYSNKGQKAIKRACFIR